ncbi:hypothetical protein AJ79_02374 [Helicocarpus griseus UAMH5409]|uniref:FAD-binding PCMH-type domain-containing protein n=1 Tax=Helicocarpus griseus UAMH5409 TaxID=1447875 RepID=A0A2B7Y422_9EURO|nr:hypothetical protein AJ79_02374 [Helicocarpus griseus UAMH5409]
MQNLLQLASIFLITGLSAALSYGNRPSCRCKPNDPCWPSSDQWKALNESIQGNLVSVRPVGDVCHDPTYNAEACQKVKDIAQNSFWRAEQPGAVQFLNWETLPASNESCYIDGPQSVTCDQGRISLYSALVESPLQIQEAVRFARKHNLRLAVKASGHDFLGRSSAPHSLQVSTYRMKDITFTDDFVPKGSKKGGEGSAVTIGAGVVLSDLYKASSENDVVAVGGASHTVVASGGYIQGGGHSPLGTWKGMASDNALEFQVITPKGDLITANEYQNTDLFWALRGGGGGTFGVVASVTIRTFPDPPIVLASLNISTTPDNSKGFWDAVKEFHTVLPNLNENGASGYYFIVPLNPPLPEIGTMSTVTAALMFVDQDDKAAVERLLEPLVAAVSKINNVTIATSALYSPKTGPIILDALLQGEADGTGVSVAIGSRLISREFLLSENGPAKLSQTLSSLKSEVGSAFRGHIVAGGQVAKNAGKIDSALNPAWRKTLSHLTLGNSWNSSTSFDEQRKMYENITNVEVPLLKALEPEMGAYLNEADPHESDFQESFWGENYKRLYKFKQEWDPTGLFISRLGVGSEDWDDDGLCRVR